MPGAVCSQSSAASAAQSDGGTDAAPASAALGIAYPFFKRHSGGDEFIDEEELQQMCIGLGHELSAQDLQSVMQALDTSGDGLIGFEEFLQWWEVSLKVDALLDTKLGARVRDDVERATQVAHDEAVAAAGASSSGALSAMEKA